MFAAMTCALLGACATISPQKYAADSSRHQAEREALKTAAAEVSRTAWPKPENPSLGARLTGFIGGDRDSVSKDDAVEAYVAILITEKAPGSQLMEDAARHLEAAWLLAEAADAAAVSVRPTGSDIAVVESAIGDLREHRDIYLATVKMLEKSNALAAQNDPDEAIKTSFNEAIKLIGAAADRLADRIDNDRSETYAQPAMKRRATAGRL